MICIQFCRHFKTDSKIKHPFTFLTKIFDLRFKLGFSRKSYCQKLKISIKTNGNFAIFRIKKNLCYIEYKPLLFFDR